MLTQTKVTASSKTGNTTENAVPNVEVKRQYIPETFTAPLRFTFTLIKGNNFSMAVSYIMPVLEMEMRRLK
ncbi:hypothetical protein T11_8211 [Trichinella zimbabwensis]|uniref:Uncharacterized protein n=1 Tax=Trichinella zimbabwensis TaxID=268475 RepID=A0A0V1HAU7_9BILA|nr:hypothetical protein T11_8211 [Trichinella zimbabwensis]